MNKAIVWRASGYLEEARAIDERCYADLAEALRPEHPYTICAGVSLATDHALAGDTEKAAALSAQMLEISQDAGGHEERGGAEHPYRLMCMANLALDLRALGQTERAESLHRSAMEGLVLLLGEAHPEVQLVAEGERTEGDIEPPPT